MEENLLDFNKIRCNQHPLQIITNYCANDKCMMGLCSECVCVHTQMHLLQNTQPILKPIKDVHKNTHKQIFSYISQLESDKERIVQLMSSISDRRSSYKKIMQQAKAEVLKTIDTAFQQMQWQFQQQVKNQLKKTGLHSSFQIQSLLRKVNRQISMLINEAHLLNSNKFLNIIKNFKSNTHNQLAKVRAQVLDQLKQNQQFVPKLQYRRQYLPEIQLLAKRMINQKFVYPRISYKPRNQPSFIQQAYKTTQGFFNTKQNSQSILFKTDGFKYSIPLNVIQIKQNLSNQNMRRSAINNQKLAISIPKNQRSPTILQRSNSTSNVSYVSHIPQFLDSNNFPLQIDNRIGRNNAKIVTMSGSKVFTQATHRR